MLRFFFPAESDKWLSYLRVGLGIEIVFYSLSLRSDWTYFFSGSDHGVISRDLAEKILSLDSPLIPRLGWIAGLGTQLGLSEETVLSIAWGCLLFAGCAMLLGIFSRLFAVLAWFLHLSITKSGALVSYGVDNFTTIGLFYLMLSPLPDRWSIDHSWRELWRKNRHEAAETRYSTRTRQSLGFWRRVLELHLCLIYFFSGLTKCLGNGWWNGSNLWRSLIRPPFNVIASETLVRWKYLFPIAGASIALLELSYPFLIWGRRARKVWLACICLMHGAIALSMGMYLFGLVMIVLNLAAFARDVAPLRTWRILTRVASRWP